MKYIINNMEVFYIFNKIEEGVVKSWTEKGFAVPGYISEITGIDLENTLLVLASLVNNNKLEMVFYYKCPKCGAVVYDITEDQVSEISKVEYLKCIKCKEPDYGFRDNTVLYFNLTKEYKEFLETDLGKN